MKIGLYIHIPFCHSKCYYCDFLSFPGSETQTLYVEALVKEIKNYGKMLGSDYTIKSIFIGGGTPTVLPPLLLDKICQAVREHFILEQEAEWTIEVNPGTLTKESINILNTHPITRISMGLQSTHDRLLQLIGRVHTFKDWENSVYLLKEQTNLEINADIMFALPTQTFKEFEETLGVVAQYDLDHLSLYALIIEEGTRFGNLYKEGKIDLADEKSDREMYHYAKDYLKSLGYQQYEISNWAQNHKTCTHNILYWQREPYIGVGLGAHSFFNNRRYHNAATMKDYLSASGQLKDLRREEEVITTRMAMEEFMFLGLRMTEGISMPQFKTLFKEDIMVVYKEQIEKWIKYKILVNNKNRLYLSDYGMDVCNQVFSSFL